MLSDLWRFEFFGGLRLRQGSREITQFRTRKTASLIAYLAYYPKRIASRDELAELLWPEIRPNSGRVNIRTALASLRRQLEPAGVPPGTVIVADNHTIRLNPDAFTSDVADFDRRLRDAFHFADVRGLIEAVDMYQGEFLPGYYEDWIFLERTRLANACYNALLRLVAVMEQSGNVDGAVDYALRAVGIDPLREEAHGDLIRLYTATHRYMAARQQYRILEYLLHQELNAKPSPVIRALIGKQ